MPKVVIFGVGQIADVADVYLTHDSPHEVAAFAVDGTYLDRKEHRGRPVVAFDRVEEAFPPGRFNMFLPISYRSVNRFRAQRYAEAKQKGYRLISYVSSHAITWPGLRLGENCFVMEKTAVLPFATIGSNVILWTGCSIGHNVTIGDHCFIGANAMVSGGVSVGPYSFLGTSATIRDNVAVAAESVIGAGALILRDTRERGVYSGLPARLLPTPSDALEDI